MEFHLFDKVEVIEDVKFESCGIIVRKGAKGIIIDICKSVDGAKTGFTLELPEYSNFDPTFTFEETQLRKL